MIKTRQFAEQYYRSWISIASSTITNCHSIVAVVISGYAEGEEICQYASESGTFPTLAAAINNHPFDSDVLRWSATAILRLTHDSASRALMAIATGVAEALGKTPPSELAKSNPKDVVAKVQLAQRWLSMHSRVFAHATGRMSSPLAAQ